MKTKESGSRQRYERIRSGELKVPDNVHGTPGGYSNWLCRCAACRRAWSDRQFAYMSEHPEQRERSRQRERLRDARLRRQKGGQTRGPYRPRMLLLEDLLPKLDAEHREKLLQQLGDEGPRYRPRYLLLDDVLAELDAEQRERLLRQLGDGGPE